MQSTEQYAIPDEEEVLKDMEALEQGLPFEDYERDQDKLRKLIAQLEKEYDRREKAIDHIMKYGTGIESEKALRMYSTAVLEKWEDSLERFCAEKLLKK
jgi:hypothetical protein